MKHPAHLSACWDEIDRLTGEVETVLKRYRELNEAYHDLAKEAQRLMTEKLHREITDDKG